MTRPPSWLPRLLLLATLCAVCAALSGCPDDDPRGDADATDGETAWTEAFDATDAGLLLSTWGPDPSTQYAVGGAPDQGVIMQRVDGAWSRVDVGVETPLLNWISGFGPDDITVVGNGGTILHWDGAAWSLQASPTDEDLWGVWGSAPDDLWAVGGGGREEGQDTILRYDGAAWREVEAPTLERPGVNAFFKVWGTASDDVYIVGQRGAVLHWDGAQLTEALVGTSLDLISLWGTGPDHIAIVGGRSNGVLVTWDGAAWRSHPLAPLPGLNGVWMRDPDTIHAVGVRGTLVTLPFADPVAYEEQSVNTLLDFHAVFGDASGLLTTVGGSLSRPIAPFEGIAYQRQLEDGE